MDMQVEMLTHLEVPDFFKVFSQVLHTEFPGYSKNVVRYFLEKVYTPASFSYWLQYNLKTVFIARKLDNIVGFAVIDQPYGGVSFCRWLGVKKEFQKKGIGKKLIESWIHHAREEKCHKAEVAAQSEAKEFYEKMGLELEGKRKLSYFGIDQYIFGKVIGVPSDEIMTKF